MVESYEIDYRIVREDGELRYLHERAEVRRDEAGQLRELEGIVHDVTQRRLAEEQAYFLAFHDALTRLPNRRLLLETLQSALARRTRHGGALAVLVLDLDRFKTINDSLGHAAGDRLLCGVAERLKAALRFDDPLARADGERIEATLGRLGGDEFIIVIDEVTDPRDAARVVDRVQSELRSLFVLEEGEFAVTASVGISVFPQDGSEAETLLANAGSAMHHARLTSPGHFEYFDRSMNEAAFGGFRSRWVCAALSTAVRCACTISRWSVSTARLEVSRPWRVGSIPSADS